MHVDSNVPNHPIVLGSGCLSLGAVLGPGYLICTKSHDVMLFSPDGHHTGDVVMQVSLRVEDTSKSAALVIRPGPLRPRDGEAETPGTPHLPTTRPLPGHIHARAAVAVPSCCRQSSDVHYHYHLPQGPVPQCVPGVLMHATAEQQREEVDVASPLAGTRASPSSSTRNESSVRQGRRAAPCAGTNVRAPAVLAGAGGQLPPPVLQVLHRIDGALAKLQSATGATHGVRGKTVRHARSPDSMVKTKQQSERSRAWVSAQCSRSDAMMSLAWELLVWLNMCKASGHTIGEVSEHWQRIAATCQTLGADLGVKPANVLSAMTKLQSDVDVQVPQSSNLRAASVRQQPGSGQLARPRLQKSSRAPKERKAFRTQLRPSRASQGAEQMDAAVATHVVCKQAGVTRVLQQTPSVNERSDDEFGTQRLRQSMSCSMATCAVDIASDDGELHGVDVACSFDQSKRGAAKAQKPSSPNTDAISTQGDDQNAMQHPVVADVHVPCVAVPSAAALFPASKMPAASTSMPTGTTQHRTDRAEPGQVRSAAQFLDPAWTTKYSAQSQCSTNTFLLITGMLFSQGQQGIVADQEHTDDVSHALCALPTSGQLLTPAVLHSHCTDASIRVIEKMREGKAQVWVQTRRRSPDANMS
jgi:hypothetical protein